MTSSEPLPGQVAVVTGGGGGIGTQVALELARQGALVVAMDPGVGVRGEPLHEPTAEATARRIADAGGTARASTASVTDPGQMQALFHDVVAEFGSLDIVVNTAGVIHSETLPDTTMQDWHRVVDVHVGGYVNVLAAALPIMASAGRGRVVGFTSGVGLARTSETSPAYGSAKRAVAALTWQVGPLAPPGVAINALSPIAATRMVAQALAGGSGASPRGLDLSAMPQPEDMAPAAVWLATDAPLRGEVVFSAGPELSLIAPPSLVEGVRTDGDFGAALDTLVPVVLGPANAGQGTTGGSNPRFGRVWGPSGPAAPPPGAGSPEPPSGDFGTSGPTCLVVADDRSVESAISNGLKRWGASVASSSSTADDLPPALDAIVVALCPRSVAGDTWEALIDEHRTVTERLAAHAEWARAASRLARDSARPVRIVHVVGATTAAGKTVAQAVTQLARSSPPSVPVASFAVGLESDRAADLGPLGELCGRLACASDAAGLAGAELAVLPGWAALRRHPGPVATLSFGERDIPGWAADAFTQR